jgi:predicted AAA+ superfamily ATPase
LLTVVRTIVRSHYATLRARLLGPPALLQVVAGPRQVGKTTLVRQVVEGLGRPAHLASADAPAPPDARWIEQQWDLAVRLAGDEGVLVIDEVQKVRGWAEVVKARWDEDRARVRGLRVVLLGSSPLLVQRGLTESLAGRFEVLRMAQWSWPEMREAFDVSIEDYVRFGGYPGAAPLAVEPARWAAYVRDALIETTLARDVLLMTRVDKPALLRQLFELACASSSQELSYTKMLGQLQDAGNTTTLAHYLELLSGAGLVSGLQKHAGEIVRARGSSPKLQVHDTGLVTSRLGAPPDPRADPELWGRLVESAVGAHLLRTAPEAGVSVRWWREGRDEVDFVLQRGAAVLGVEVKTARTGSLRALARFEARFPGARTLVVGSEGVPLEVFLSRPAAEWM